MKSGYLICVIGIDGSGKTTQAKELVKNLQKKGIKCKYVYGRIIPIIPRPFMFIGRKVFLRNSSVKKNYKDYSRKKKNLFQNSILSTFYQNIFIFDYLLQVFFKIKFPLFLGYTLISDRYAYDTVITDLSIDLNYSDNKIGKLIQNILKVIPNPDASFLIDINENIAFSRKNDVPSIEYLIQRRENYLKMANLFNMDIIDGNNNVEKIQTYLLSKVFTLFSKTTKGD